MRIARLVEQQSGSETRLATAQGTPDLTLTANYSRQYSRFDDQLGLIRQWYAGAHCVTGMMCSRSECRSRSALENEIGATSKQPAHELQVPGFAVNIWKRALPLKLPRRFAG